MSIKFIANEPWAINEAGLQLVLAVASRDDFFAQVREKALAALDGKPLDNTRAVTMRDDVAVIPVHGPLFRKGNLLTAVSGATSYESLRKDLQSAVDNPRVSAILFDFDSPGGEAKGVSEMAQAIREASRRKRVEAYVGGMAASAAYWLATATQKVTISDTATLGSIGTIAAYQKSDDGTIEIRSSQSPYKNLPPETEEGRARIQARLDAMTEVFIDAVASYRGVDSATVLNKFGRGDVLVGRRAVGVGMADGIGTFESTLATMTNAIVSFGRSQISAVEAAQPMSLADFGRMEIYR